MAKDSEKKDLKSGLAEFAKKNFGLDNKPQDETGETRAVEKLKMRHAENIRNPAFAPYNFVPLNSTVVESEEKPGEESLPFNKYHGDRNTGLIELTIETKTPLYIRDTLTAEEMEQGKEAKDISDFFSPAGKIRIPGSSLRGMIRTMVEMVSFGKFKYFDDKRLYFRAVADTSKLGSDYRKLMVNENDNYFPKIEAGILKKNGQSYVIYPSKKLPPGNNGTQIYRINYDKKTKIVAGTKDLIVQPFESKIIYFKPVAPTDHLHKRYDRQKKEIPYKLKYAKLASVSEGSDADHPNKGFIIASGEFGNKKHMHWVINEPENSHIKIEEGVIKEYINDSSRDERTDLLKKLEKNHNGVPCFYLVINGKIVSFGHTGMFRLAYKKTIGEHIPEELKDERKIDIAEAIFGDESKFTGRVFFEDADLTNSDGRDFEEEKIPATLLGPKPTTFQHYLVQSDENLNNHPRGLAHYNSDTAIRGNKLYWHKSPRWVKPDQKEFNEKIDTKIKPVKSEKIFKGKIRFENLSDIELGALLFAIALPDGCCHKLGMGKPLGLGSVKITPKLFLSERKTRYQELFAEWEEPKPESQDKNILHFKKEFEKNILKKIGESKTDLWEVDRMKELKRMLAFSVGTAPDGRPSDNKLQYMGLGEFRDRRVLPKPTKV